MSIEKWARLRRDDNEYWGQMLKSFLGIKKIESNFLDKS